MGLVIGIDTGKNMGWAWGWNGTLSFCGLWNLTLQEDINIQLPWVVGRPNPGVAIIEVPEYRQENNRAKIDALLVLSARAGRAQEWALSNGFELRLVKPSEWKGSLSKDIHHNHIRKRLTPPERDVMARCLENIPHTRHNDVLDGIGLFLYQVGRDANRGIGP